MSQPIVWETGPLGYFGQVSSPCWEYWTTQCRSSSRTWQAWYFPGGIIDDGELLGDELPSQEKAAALCQKHADRQEASE
jgi:hypothetical protein